MAYLLFYLCLKPLSWLPLSLTYRLSAGLYHLLYNVFGYRKAVVLDNLRRSFPEKSPAQIKAVCQAYYRFFCDSIFESIRLFSMPEEETIRRCRVTNPELLSPFAAAGKSVILLGAHYANWEIAALAFYQQLLPHVTMGIYSPLKNETMDRLIMGNRKRFGTRLVSRRKVQEYFDKPPAGLSADFFIGDQSPSNAAWEKLHWTLFLQQPTSFVMGAERYAVRYNRPVFYMRLRRIGKGLQEATLVPISEEPQTTSPGFITETYARELEKEIQNAPEFWLWTHRRWKRSVPDEILPLLAQQPYVAGEYER